MIIESVTWMGSIRASVAMAVYNGERYLAEQIESILQTLSENDELVISDDGSTDKSLQIIHEYQLQFPNLIVHVNTGDHGICGNYTNAIKHCRGEYIFLSDQDDVWKDGKTEAVLKAFEETGADLVIHDGNISNEKLELKEKTLLSGVKTTTNPFLNWFKGRYFGCCMAFRNNTCDYLMPFPKDVPHDIYTSILVGVLGKVVIIPECYIIHRIHGKNETPETRRSLWVIFWDRMLLGRRILGRLIRYRIFEKHRR